MTERVHDHRQPPQQRQRTNIYQSALDESDAGVFAEAEMAEGLNDEVAAVRVLLRRHLAEQPEKLELTIKAMHLLVRMVATQYKLSGADAAELDAHTSAVVDQVRGMLFAEEAAHG